MPINAQHRSELDFAGKFQDIADETKPIVFSYVYSLGAFSGSRNYLTTHRVVLSSFVRFLDSRLRVRIEHHYFRRRIERLGDFLVDWRVHYSTRGVL
jgi:hypothetical protein